MFEIVPPKSSLTQRLPQVPFQICNIFQEPPSSCPRGIPAQARPREARPAQAPAPAGVAAAAERPGTPDQAARARERVAAGSRALDSRSAKSGVSDPVSKHAGLQADATKNPAENNLRTCLYAQSQSPC